jgi:thiamine biosynthesis lipoprotein
MGTWLRLEVEGADRAQALEASERAVRAVEATEARLSTWRDDSELARLNRSPVGEAFALSPETARDLALARELWRATDGAFDPGIGGLVRAWGLRSGGRQPGAGELAALLEARGLASLALEGTSARRLHPLLELEEGGFGKGVALDAAVRELAASGVEHALLDLGGQVALVGRRATVVELADPRDRGRPVLALELESGSLSTSGNAERAVTVGDTRIGHILDPRTGEPARDFGSVSVLAADATTADVLSTALYVLGPDGALAWASEHPPIECLVLEVLPHGLRARASAGWPARLVALVPELEILRSPPSDARIRPGGSIPSQRHLQDP